MGDRRPSCQERALLQRGRPPTRGGDELWVARRARRLQDTRLGVALRSGGTEAGGCVWPLWPTARPLTVSSTRLRRAWLRRGHSSRTWHVTDGLRVRAVGGGGGAGENGLKVGGRGQLRLILCVNRAFRNGGASADVSRRRGRRLQGRPPPRMLCTLLRAACVHAHAYARGHVRVCVYVCT